MRVRLISTTQTAARNDRPKVAITLDAGDFTADAAARPLSRCNRVALKKREKFLINNIRMCGTYPMRRTCDNLQRAVLD
jgi:hypothetical protein